MSSQSEGSQELWVVVLVVHLSLGGEAHSLREVVLSAAVEPFVAPHAEAQQVAAVVLPAGAPDEMVNVKAGSRPADSAKLKLTGEGSKNCIAHSSSLDTCSQAARTASSNAIASS
jgi:hypothetical protein